MLILSPIYKCMKINKITFILFITPLLLSFSASGETSDEVRLAPFTIKPLNYSVSNTLKFSFITNSRLHYELNVRLLLKNSNFTDYLVDESSGTVTGGRSYKTDFILKPFYLTNRLNVFTLEYSFGAISRQIQFRVGAFTGDSLKLPAISILKDMFLGVSYKNLTFTYSYFIFEYSNFLASLSLANDLYINLDLFSAPFALENEITAEKVSLIFKNKAALFPRLEKTSDGDPYVPLLLNYQNGNIIYKLENPLYVDDETHIVSATKDMGFRLTNKIYLPKNKKADLEYGDYELRIERFTSVKYDITYTFKVSIDRPFLASNGTYDIDFRWQ